MNVDFRVWWLVSILLIGLLLISVGVNYVLVKQYRHAMRQWALATLDPLGLHLFAGAADAGNEGELPTALFFGDSRAAAWPAPDLDSFTFINRGVNGQTSAQVLARYEAHVAPLRPDVLVVQMCVNDLRVIPVLPHDEAQIVAQCQENVAAVVRRAREGKTAVVLTTIFPVQSAPPLERMYWSEDVVTAIETVNDHIRSLAGEQVVVLDAYALLVDDSGYLRREYAADNLHVNAAGYELLNEALAPVLPELMRNGRDE